MWKKLIVEKFCSLAALDIAMLKSLVEIFWSSCHMHSSTNQYSSGVFEPFSKTFY
jgi:hypothetical protein